MAYLFRTARAVILSVCLMTVGEWIVARFEKDPALAFFDPPASRATVPGERDDRDK